MIGQPVIPKAHSIYNGEQFVNSYEDGISLHNTAVA